MGKLTSFFIRHTSSNTEKHQSNLTAYLAKFSLPVAFLCYYPHTASATEFQYGKGDWKIQGGLLGMEAQLATSASTFRIHNPHSNLYSSQWFYQYGLTYYSSHGFKSQEGPFSMSNGATLLLDAIDYELTGFDGLVTFGYDIYRQNPRNYFSLGVSAGLALPYLKNSGSEDSAEKNGFGPDWQTSAKPFLEAGKSFSASVFPSTTKMSGYGIGPSLQFSKSLGNYFSFYGDVTYTRQNLHLSNNTLFLKSKISGDYLNYGLGLRLQPFSYRKSLGPFLFEPAFFVTAGVNYSEMTLNNVSVNVSGFENRLANTELKTQSTIYYLGIGYQF